MNKAFLYFLMTFLVLAHSYSLNSQTELKLDYIIDKTLPKSLEINHYSKNELTEEFEANSEIKYYYSRSGLIDSMLKEYKGEIILKELNYIDESNHLIEHKINYDIDSGKKIAEDIRYYDESEKETKLVKKIYNSRWGNKTYIYKTYYNMAGTKTCRESYFEDNVNSITKYYYNNDNLPIYDIQYNVRNIDSTFNSDKSLSCDSTFGFKPDTVNFKTYDWIQDTLITIELRNSQPYKINKSYCTDSIKYNSTIMLFRGDTAFVETIKITDISKNYRLVNYVDINEKKEIRNIESLDDRKEGRKGYNFFHAKNEYKSKFDYRYNYTYDSKGNWISRITYNESLEKIEEVKRKIEYY